MQKTKPISNGVNFPKLEEEVLRRWQEQKTFEKSVARRKPPAFAKASAGK